MNPNKELWEKGDFTKIAETMRESGEEFVAQLGITEGLKVLDLGCGDGTTALPEARLGADVLGVDIAANLVEAGTLRAEKEGLQNVRFQEGDAASLTDLADDSFDLVVTVFGAMFAPRPSDVAREMVRVTKQRGRIVMGNWIPGDPTLPAQMFRISATYAPPPPEGFISPLTWGVQQNVEQRFEEAGVPKDHIRCEPQSWTFRFEGEPSAYLALFRSYFGPAMNAFAGAESNGRTDELQKELEDLFSSQNLSADPGQTIFRANFLRVTVEV